MPAPPIVISTVTMMKDVEGGKRPSIHVELFVRLSELVASAWFNHVFTLTRCEGTDALKSFGLEVHDSRQSNRLWRIYNQGFVSRP